MKTKCAWFLRSLAGAVLVWTTVTGGAATLKDFGHGSVTVGSSRPLLMVLGDFDCFPERRLDKPDEYYRRMIFDRNTYPSVNGWLWENSLGRFQFTPAGTGVAGRYLMKTNESFPYYVATDINNCEFLYYSNVMRRPLRDFTVNFPEYDKNGNGQVEVWELSWTFVNNYGGGASRSCPELWLPGTLYTVGGGDYAKFWPTNSAITANHAQGDFASLVHEQVHQLGVYDLYGKMGIHEPGRFTIMGRTLPRELVEQPNNTNYWYYKYTWNLDAWSRMLLGWCEPRLVAMENGGKFRLPAAQLREANGPILLYSKKRADYNKDYFLLEYRTANTRSAGKGYDADLWEAGLVIWHYHPDEAVWHVPFVYVASPPDLQGGDGHAWPSGSTTPKLKWLDGTSTDTQISVHPFNPDDDAITIEIITTGNVYVDFASTAQPETGSFSNPYNTLAEAVAAAPWGGTLYIKGGTHTIEKPVISKALTLLTYGTGGTTIGR